MTYKYRADFVTCNFGSSTCAYAFGSKYHIRKIYSDENFWYFCNLHFYWSTAVSYSTGIHPKFVTFINFILHFLGPFDQAPPFLTPQLVDSTCYKPYYVFPLSTDICLKYMYKPLQSTHKRERGVICNYRSKFNVLENRKIYYINIKTYIQKLDSQ